MMTGSYMKQQSWLCNIRSLKTYYKKKKIRQLLLCCIKKFNTKNLICDTTLLCMHLHLRHRVEQGTNIQEQAVERSLKLEATLSYDSMVLCPSILKRQDLLLQLLSPYGTALGHVHTRIISTTQATTKKNLQWWVHIKRNKTQKCSLVRYFSDKDKFSHIFVILHRNTKKCLNLMPELTQINWVLELANRFVCTDTEVQKYKCKPIL